MLNNKNNTGPLTLFELVYFFFCFTHFLFSSKSFIFILTRQRFFLIKIIKLTKTTIGISFQNWQHRFLCKERSDLFIRRWCILINSELYSITSCSSLRSKNDANDEFCSLHYNKLWLDRIQYWRFREIREIPLILCSILFRYNQ